MSATTRAPGRASGRAIGAPLDRIDGPQKVTGTAPYAYEHHVDYPMYLYPLQSDIARGRITRIDASEAEALPGVVIVITHENAPRLADTGDRELAVLQSDEVAFRGQYVGAVIAETIEVARHAASLVRISYDEEPHDAVLRADRDDLYTPERVNAGFLTDTEEGDFDEAFLSAAVTLDETYTTPIEHNNPMEPHTTVAVWEAGDLTLYESTQGAHSVRKAVARAFGLDRDRVRVVAPYVGGGFGSKGLPHANTILAALAAQAAEGRPVKFALTRQQMFSGVGYRPPPYRGYGSARTEAAISPPSPTTSSSRPPSRPGRCTRRRAVAPRTGSPPSTCRCRRGCARPVKRPECSRLSRRWTRWR
jgi:xanthine dehydrogenase YagR molybdenum-binding subunit